MSIPQELLGTIPGWITSAGVVAILSLVVRWQLGLKRLSVEAQQVEVNARAAANVNSADIRDHYAEELKRNTEEIIGLRGQLRDMEDHYRRMLTESDRRHEDCEIARAAMREELEGLKLQFKQRSADTLIELEAKGQKPSDVAPHAVASAERVKRIVEGGK